MKFTKNELKLMRYVMEDLMNGDDIPENKTEFEKHVDELINKIDNELNQ